MIGSFLILLILQMPLMTMGVLKELWHNMRENQFIKNMISIRIDISDTEKHFLKYEKVVYLSLIILKLLVFWSTFLQYPLTLLSNHYNYNY